MELYRGLIHGSSQVVCSFCFLEVRLIQFFKAVKEKIDTKTVARHYGLKIRSNGMACCPFHSDKHPSLKVDENYYCFACGAHGDAIDFVARMFGLSQFEAAKKLNDDFSLGIEMNLKKIKSKRKKKIEKSNHEKAALVQKKIEQWVREATEILIRYLKWIEFWKEFYKPQNMEEEWHPLFIEALENETKINYYLDILMFEDGEAVLELFKTHREEIKQYGKRIEEYQRGILAEFGRDCN